jgi:hypothetical protein
MELLYDRVLKAAAALVGLVSNDLIFTTSYILYSFFYTLYFKIDGFSNILFFRYY